MKFEFKMFFALLFAISVIACGSEEKSEDLYEGTYVKGSVGENKKAPEFSLNDINGKKVNLSDYKGKIVVLDFWATWCPPCREGIPDLISLQNEFKKDVVIIGISLDQKQTVKDVTPFVKDYGINYPVVFGNMEIAKAYGNINSIPTSFIVDREGNITNKHIGLVAKDVYVKEIKQLLNKKS